MITNSIIVMLINIVEFFFGWVYLPTFDFSAFDTYLTWFNTLLDSAVSLLAFLIPRPVFRSSVLIALFVVEFDHVMMLIKWVIGFIPLIGNGVNSKGSG